jgi:Holliday junction DNA helicase RuvA
MIHKLKGRIDTIKKDMIILDVSGVGYGIFCSSNTINQLPGKDEFITLYIETHVREDHIHLFGFATEDEQNTFNIIIKVNGVGVKVALAILSVFSASKLANIIASEDAAAFKIVSGVGPKLAARIITELKGKFAGFNSTLPNTDKQSSIAYENDDNNVNDAISALVNLGYSRSEAYNTITKIAAQNDNAPISLLIKQGLQELSNS